MSRNRFIGPELHVTGTRRALFAVLMVFALSLSVAGCQPSLVPARQGLLMRNVELPVRQLVYPSGLRVVAERDARTKVVGLFLVVGSGSSSDPSGKEGLAHYIEHLAFRSRPYGRSGLRRLLERAGAGEWNAFTSLDATVYHEVGPSSALNELLRLEGARMRAPVTNLTAETLAVELDVVRSELRERNETNFSGETLGALQKVVFPAGHPYARPVIGTHDSLTSIKVEDIKAFLDAHYQPDNMTLAIVGDIDISSIDTVLQQVLPPDLLRARPSKPRAAFPEKAPEPPAPPPTVLTRAEASVDTPELWIGWSLPRAFDTDTHFIGMVEDMAEYGLRQAQRESVVGPHGVRDIAYIDMGLVQGKEASMLVCRVVLHKGTDPERSLNHVLNFTLDIWDPMDQAKRMGANDAVAQVEGILFGSRQRQAVVNMLLETEDLAEHGTTRALTTHFTKNPMTYQRSFDKVIGVRQETLVDFAEKYLARDRARAVLFTPFSGGPRADARPIGAQQLGEEDSLPLRVDEAWLASIAPPPKVSGFKHFTLPNGLAVVIGRREGSPSATVRLMLRGGRGGAEDPTGAELAMGLMRPPKWNAHGSPVEFGAQSKRLLLPDKMVHGLDGAAGNVGMMIAIMAERVRGLYVSNDSFRYVRDYLVPHLKLLENKPEAIAQRAFQKSLFAGHPYGRIPTADDLAGSSAEAADAWIDATHVPNNAALAVIGEFNVVEIEKIVRAEFGGWGAGPKAPATVRPHESARAAAPSAAPAMKVIVTERTGATQAQLQLGCVFPVAQNPFDDVQHDVAAQIVETRLGEVLRERGGMTYGIRANALVFRGGTSFLGIRGAVERTALAAALTTLRDTVRQLGETAPSDNELAWAKLRAARSRTTMYVTNRAIAESVLSMMNLGFPIESLETTAASIAGATRARVQDDLRACFAGGLTLSIVGDESTVHAALKETGLR